MPRHVGISHAHHVHDASIGYQERDRELHISRNQFLQDPFLGRKLGSIFVPQMTQYWGMMGDDPWPSSTLRSYDDQIKDDLAMDQYLYIPFLGG